jgi:hypothetical protein
MNNPAIEQALFELEESLKQIKSANDNVNNVSQKSEQLVVTMTKVIASLNAISSNVSIDKEAIQDQLTENKTALKTGIKKILKDANESYTEIRNNIFDNQASFVNQLTTLLDSIVSKLDLELQSFKISIKSSVDTVQADIEAFSKELIVLRESVKSLEDSLDDLSSRVSKTDINSEFRKLNFSVNRKFKVVIITNLFLFALASIAVLTFIYFNR